MAMTRIAGALAVVVLTSCSVEEPVEEPVQSQRVTPVTPATMATPVTTAKTGAVENAGLRADFNAP